MLESRTEEVEALPKDVYAFLVDWVRSRYSTILSISPNTQVIRYRSHGVFGAMDVTIDVNRNPGREGSLVLVKTSSRKKKVTLSYLMVSSRQDSVIDAVFAALLDRFPPPGYVKPPPKPLPPKPGCLANLFALFFLALIIGTCGRACMEIKPKDPAPAQPIDQPSVVSQEPTPAPKPKKKKKPVQKNKTGATLPADNRTVEELIGLPPKEPAQPTPATTQ